MPPKLLALLPANQIPRTLACVARRDSGLTESKTRMTNPTDLRHLAVSLSIRPYLPLHRRPDSSWLGVTESLSVLSPPQSKYWVWEFHELELLIGGAPRRGPRYNPLLPQASMRPADMQYKCRSCWLTCVLICYRQRGIGFVVTYNV